MTEADHQNPAASRARPVVAGAAILLVLVLVVLGAAATGPWQRPLDDTASSGHGVTAPTLPMPSATEEPTSIPPIDEGSPGDGTSVLQWFLFALALVVAIALALLLLRFLSVWLRRRDAPVLDARIAPVTENPEVDAPTLREGIVRARGILDSDRPPRDAIVQAWLALEQAAVAAGVGRRPSQTPTEFTTVVLDRTPAQREAVGILRDLYSRVRFSDAPVTDADGEAARAAIMAIAEHWSAVAAQQ